MPSPNIEDVERFWSSRPCNFRHARVSIDEDPLLFSQQVTERKYRVEPHIPKFAEFDLWKGKSVLEFGSGIGTDTIKFAKASAIVHAVDISEESMAIAAKRLSAEGQSFHLFTANIESIDIALKSYDLVYSFGVIHHTPDPARAVANAYRHLKPGGEFRLMLYNRYSWKAFWILAKFGKFQFWKWPKLVARHSEAQTGCPITHTYTKRSARKLLEKAGFEVKSIEIDHIFPYKIKDYKKHVYVKEWWWRRMPRRLFEWMEHHFGWHMLIKAVK